MSKLPGILRLLIIFLFLGHFSTNGVTQAPAIEVRLLGCDSLPVLYTFNGFRYIPVQRGAELDLNRYGFTLSPGPSRILFVGSTPEEHIPVIVGGGQSPVLDGHCLNMAGSEVYGSPINQKFRTFRDQIDQFRERQTALLVSLSKAGSAAAREPVWAEVRALDQEKMALLQEARQADPLLGAYVGLFTFLNAPGLASGRQEDEVQHFGTQYFAQAELSDPVYNRIPQVYDSYLEYTQTLLRLSMPDPRRETFLKDALGRIPPGRPARRLAYAGILEGLRAQAFGLYADLSEQFLAEFPNLPAPVSEDIRAESVRARALAIGGQAPSFRQPDPAGQPVSLQALKGKVVFIDFWASWCRPCRQENPRLRKIYGNFRGQGFEVVGISLDVEKERWVKAIEADQISWLQGSDLLGWSNAAAVDYRVGAIPHNVLIDRQGRILARNLSVDELESKLREVL